MTFVQKFRRWLMSSPRPPEERPSEPVVFLAEQKGPAEDALVAALTPLLQRHAGVRRAYLVRGSSSSTDASTGVYLALRATGIANEMALVESVGKVFAKIFNREEHLDVLFLTDETEEQVRKVSPPFFER